MNTDIPTDPPAKIIAVDSTSESTAPFVVLVLQVDQIDENFI